MSYYAFIDRSTLSVRVAKTSKEMFAKHGNRGWFHFDSDGEAYFCHSKDKALCAAESRVLFIIEELCVNAKNLRESAYPADTEPDVPTPAGPIKSESQS